MVLRLFAVVVVMVLAGASARAEESPPAAEETPREVAADGTASVVVPAAEAPADPAVDPPPAAVESPRAAPPEGMPAAVVPPPAAAVPDPPADPAPSPAAGLLAAVLEPVEPAPAWAAGLSARPLSLREALERPGDPSRRLWIAQAYWKVSVAWAWLRWSAEAVDRLELVAPGADPHDRAALDVATAAARADLAEARSQLGVAQQELVDLARLPITEPLPWPVDRPLATPYQTHFDAIFAARMATGRTRAIARTLPARHEALESRATAVAAAERALAMAEADHAQGRRPIEAVVAAHAALVGQQREFLAAVRAYNLDIAEYAMAVADLSVPEERFVAMLIGAPPPDRPPAAPLAGPPPGTAAPGGPAP